MDKGASLPTRIAMYKNALLIAGISLLYHLAFSQCFPDRHSTSFQDGWISCAKRVNPNPTNRPVSHWLRYDLGHVYKLGSSQFWNTNHPDLLSVGVKRALVDYSMDGQNWIEAGEYTFDIATGRSVYEGSEGPDLAGIEARYLLFTILENHGHGDCAGFSEWKIEIEDRTTSLEDFLPEEVLKIFPNPFDNLFNVEIRGAYEGAQYYEVRDLLGRLVLQSREAQGNSFVIPAGELQAGQYFLRVFNGTSWMHAKIIALDSKY